MRYLVNMKTFLVLIGLHWIEHLFQVYQIYFLHMHRECAFGFLGMKYPWLVQTEVLHFAFAGFTFSGMWLVAQNYFTSNKAVHSWVVGWLWSAFHFVEHLLLFWQALLHHNIFGRPVPTSMLQLIFPRVELHLVYNTIITYFIMKALIDEYRFQRSVIQERV